MKGKKGMKTAEKPGRGMKEPTPSEIWHTPFTSQKFSKSEQFKKIFARGTYQPHRTIGPCILY